MVSKVVDALAGKSTTTGTGTYSITGNVTGFREFAQMNDGEQVVAVIRNDVDLEIGLYTKDGGSSPTLARTTIYMNKSGTTSAVNWAGGEKDIRSTIEASILPLLIQNNIWLADQYFRGKKICLDTGDDSYIYSDVDGDIVLVLNNIEFARFSTDAPNTFRLTYSDDGTGSGPKFSLQRNSTSPAANDTLGEIPFSGKNSAGASQIYAKIQAYISDPTVNTEDGGLNFVVARDGAEELAFAINQSYVYVYPYQNDGAVALLAGKTSPNRNLIGAELRTDGLIVGTTNSNACLLLNRKNSDGFLAEFHRDGVAKGTISVAGEAVSYNNFIGAHLTSTEMDLADLQIGHVMEAINEPHNPDTQAYLPKVQLATAGSKKVYGVFGGLIVDRHDVYVNGLGSYQLLVKGPVESGDLLWVSDTPGVAEVQPDDIFRSHTIAKATRSDPGTGIRLVPATIHCG